MLNFSRIIAFVGLLAFSVLSLAAPRVLLVVTSHAQMGDTSEKTGLWLAELTHPYHELVAAGIEVDIASIQGGAAPIDPRSLADDDAINHGFLGNPETRSLLDNTPALHTVDAAAYEAILFAGGHGTVWDFPGSEGVKKVGSAIYARGGIVAAVCHGPAALLNVYDQNGKPLVNGKRVAAFSNAEEEAFGLTAVVPYLLQDALTEKGASYVEGPLFESHVVQDGRLITGQNPQSAAELGRVLVQALQSL